MGRRFFFCRIDCGRHLFAENRLLLYPFTKKFNFGSNAPFFNCGDARSSSNSLLYFLTQSRPWVLVLKI